MRYYLDTEFNGFEGELISLALVSETGRELYLVALECWDGSMFFEPWVAENVTGILMAVDIQPDILPVASFGDVLRQFLSFDSDPVIIADWPDDIRYFCRCLITGPGQMVNIPALRFEMVRVYSYPTTLPGAIQHNALWDARALRHRLLGGGHGG